MNRSRKQSSTDYPINFFMADSADHITGKTGLTPAVTISKNGGAFAAADGAVTEIGNGWYSLAGNTTDRDTMGEFCFHASAIGADPADGLYLIIPFDPFDSVRLGLTALPNAVPGANGGLPTQNGTKLNQTVDLEADQAVNMTKIGGVAVSTATAQIGVNVVSQDNIDFGALQKTSIKTQAQDGLATTIADAVLEESLADHKGVADSLAKALFETNQRLNSAKVVIDTDAGTIKVYDTNGTDLLFTLTKTAAGNVYTIARS